MDVAKKRRLQDILLGFFLLSHPVPVLLHILAVTLFTLLAVGAMNLAPASPRGWLPVWYVIVLVITAHAAMQVSIAMINDYCDRRLDAAGKKNKPIPRGLVTASEALVGGLAMMGLMLLLLWWLPRLALLISLCYLALGQAYNVGLKSTRWSGIVFALAMPLIPLYAFTGVGDVRPFLFWLVPLGFFLGVALNLANSLPDVEEDEAGGARTLAVYLGVKGSFRVCEVLIVLSAALIGVLTVLRVVPANGWIVVAVLIITCLSISVQVVFFGPTRAVETRKLYFYLVALTCIVLICGWLLGVFI